MVYVVRVVIVSGPELAEERPDFHVEVLPPMMPSVFVMVQLLVSVIVQLTVMDVLLPTRVSDSRMDASG